MINSQTIDRLILGIRSIISESRSSLSDEDVSLLEECLSFLEAVKVLDDPPKGLSTLPIVSSVIEILLKVLLSEALDKLKDVLF